LRGGTHKFSIIWSGNPGNKIDISQVKLAAEVQHFVKKIGRAYTFKAGQIPTLSVANVLPKLLLLSHLCDNNKLAAT